MAIVTFFEKPGCRNNTRQKAILESLGHQVVARNLLAEPWTADRLRAFFGDKPVAEWFNRAAPKVKEGIVDPAEFDEPAALAAMIADPLLIRRPLMEVDGQRRVGFDVATVHAWIGLDDAVVPSSEACPRTDGMICDH